MSNWKRKFKAKKRGLRGKRRIPKRRASLKSRRLLFFAKLAFGGLVFSIISLFVIIPLLAFNLPSPDKIVRRDGFSTKILDRKGKVLYDIYADRRNTPISISDVPESLKHATIAIEDKNFYKHQGFDTFGTIRGLSRLVTRGRAQGGSTLTQQLVKNVLLSTERTVFRKIKEFILSVQIERKFTKDEILQMYLNEVPYGGTAWGVEAAAETYFGKTVSELNLLESAILAGLPQRPSTYSPYSSNPDAYISRATDVLRRMREDEYITKEQEKMAIDKLPDIEFQKRGASFKAPHFVQYVQKILEERYGQNVVEQGGLRVTTTLDLELHEKAQKIVSEEISKVEYLDIGNGAVVVMNPQTGEILSMVGSKDFDDPDYDGQVNVTTSLRQPGSAIKPITYATALKKGYTASTLLMDVPTEFPGGIDQPIYKPENYDGKYRGPMQLRFALGNSINVAAVKMLALVGIKDTLQTAYDLGINSLEPTDETLERVGLSLTLGGGEVKLLELTSAYSAFLNKGYRVEPVAILEVVDSDGKVLEKNEPTKLKKVLSDEQAFLIANILSDNEARQPVFGPNSLLNIPGREVAVKTGTTNDKRDNWAIGGNTQIVVGAWVGNNDNTPMRNVASGVSGASPIWRRVILDSLDGKPNIGFEVPSNIVTASVDSVSGYASHDGYSSRIEYFSKGTEPGEDRVHLKLKVCKSDGKLAQPSDVSSGNYEEKEYFVFKEEDPTAGPGDPNKWQEGILSWISEQSDSRYNPPSDYCGSGSPVSISFTDPQDQTSNHPNNIEVKISSDSTSNIVEVVLYVDGTKEITFTGPPYNYSLNLPDGTHELKAVAKDANGNGADRSVRIGVGVAWDYLPPTPTPTPAPTI